MSNLKTSSEKLLSKLIPKKTTTLLLTRLRMNMWEEQCILPRHMMKSRKIPAKKKNIGLNKPRPKRNITKDRRKKKKKGLRDLVAVRGNHRCNHHQQLVRGKVTTFPNSQLRWRESLLRRGYKKLNNNSPLFHQPHLSRTCMVTTSHSVLKALLMATKQLKFKLERCWFNSLTTKVEISYL